MGDWLVFFRDGIAAWLPLLFAVMLVLMVYILWRTLQVMPKVTAAKTITASSKVSWDDVAGLDEAQGDPALRPARHGQDAAREGDRQRGGREVLRPERVGVRGDVRRPRCRAHPQTFRRGAQERALDHLH